MKSRRLLALSAPFAAALVLFLLAARPSAGQEPEPSGETEEDSEALNVEKLAAVPPPARQVAIQAPVLPPAPGAGEGRLRLELAGNRRWCTQPDDRIMRPPEGVGAGFGAKPTVRNPIYTFGYQFTIAAVNRADPAETLMLFESPVIRTAQVRQAAKLGRGSKAPPGPAILEPKEQKPTSLSKEQPSSLVPYWEDIYRCTTLPDAFDFDLPGGTYDVYMAFDIMGRSGSWAHRSIGFLTDVDIEPGRRTRLDGRVDYAATTSRVVELLESTLLPADKGPGQP